MTVWAVGQTVAGLYAVRDVHDGGMARVYRVHHLDWRIDLAVKRPRADRWHDEADRDRFIAEADAWIGLGVHPHICACHYVRVLDDVPHVFAEYCSGGTVAAALRTGRLPVPRILDIAIQTAWGLEHAHAQGLVHQDVKPANILLDADGTAKVTDFGLARALTTPTGDVTRLGLTEAYASPEQADRRRLTAQTDIWSLAVTVLELLVGGVSWYSGAAAGAFLRGYRHDPPEPAEPIPAEVADVLDACLRHDLTERTSTMTELATALVAAYETCTGGQYPRSKPTPADLRADGLVNRALSWLDLGLDDHAEQAFDEAFRIDPRNPYVSYNLGLWSWRHGRLRDDDYAEDVAEALVAAGAEAPSELLVNVHLERGDHAAARSAGATAGQLAAVRPDETVLLDDLGGRPGALAVTRDAGHVLVAVAADGDHPVVWWSVADRVAVATFTAHRAPVLGVAVSGNGRIGAAWDETGAISVLDLGRGAVHTIVFYDDELFPREPARPREVAVSGDGRTVAAVGVNPGVRLWDARSGAERPPLRAVHRGVEVSFEHVAVSADGRHVIAADRIGPVYRWGPGRDDPVAEFQAPVDPLAPRPPFITALALSDDARLAACGFGDGTVAFGAAESAWHPVVAHAGPVRRLALCTGVPGGLAVSAAEDGTVRIWGLAAGRALRTLTGPAEAARPGRTGRIDQAIAVDDEGRWVASAAGRRAHVRAVPAGFAAPFVLARPRSHTDLQAGAARVEQLLAAAGEAPPEAALELLREARALPGHERDRRLLSAWIRHAGSVRTGLRSVWAIWLATRGADQGPGRHRGRTLRLATAGAVVVSGCEDGTVLVWGLHDDEVRPVPFGFGSAIEALAVLADGTILAAADAVVRRWPGGDVVADDGEPAPPGGPFLFAVAADGRTAISSSDRHRVCVWDLATGRRIAAIVRAPGQSRVRALAITADGRLGLLSADDWTVEVWDLGGPRRIGALPGHGGPVRIAAGGGEALSGHRDGTIRLWDLRTGQGLRVLRGGSADRGLAFSPDGRFAASVGAANAVRLWDLRSGACLRTLESGTDVIGEVVFSADGQTLIVAAESGDVLAYQLDWELGKPPGHWDGTALRRIEEFVAVHGPDWTEADVGAFLIDLRRAGFGWVQPPAVRAWLAIFTRLESRRDPAQPLFTVGAEAPETPPPVRMPNSKGELKARTQREARVYIELQTCPECAHRGIAAGAPHTTARRDGTERIDGIASRCLVCGREQYWRFWFAGWRETGIESIDFWPGLAPKPSGLVDVGVGIDDWFGPAGERSNLVDAGQWIVHADRLLEEGTADAALLAAAAASEAAKFVPEGTDRVPTEGLWSRCSAELGQAAPGRFALAAIEELRAAALRRYAELAGGV
ncbi:protein kinase [Dactylosporangium sp. NPDC051541]|uniref:WD40 repeat domain-containing serine/threonine protein kinase n=1 Tax=Dactylosporangium sp. NPDC051541 TaxID=3363977 RepID=UPI0037B20CD8